VTRSSSRPGTDTPMSSGVERLFVDEPLVEIIEWIRGRFDAGAQSVVLCVLDPDLGRGRYAGERVCSHGRSYVHRPFRVWVDLAERMGARIGTPRAAGDGIVRIELEKLDEAARWEPGDDVPTTEKYGRDSGYQRIRKAEDPGFVLDLADALDRVAPRSNARVLDLGVNTGDELVLATRLRPELARSATLVGVDHSPSALEVARERLSATRHALVCADLAELPRLDLGPVFDLVLCIGTLQSPSVDDRALLRHVVQHRLSPTGAVILGLPNCRYLDGEVIFGARMKNFRQPELSLLVKHVAFYRRYLQQHRRKVYVTGKHTVLVTATPIDGITERSS
jgi:SAM-dependent methyltransferase